MLHGRGATAQDILLLVNDLAQSGFAYLAPQAAGNAWYPHPYHAPLESNEPWLSSALRLVEAVLARVSAAGIPADRTVLLGFSQGACLTLEYCARHARRYGGIAGLSGGLIGPDGTPRDYGGSLAGTPVFLGCSDPDPYIPRARVLEAAETLRRLGGQVTAKLYSDLGHQVNADELERVRSMMSDIIVGASLLT